MARKDISTLWDRDMRIAIDQNFIELYNEYIGAGLDAKEAREKAIDAVSTSDLAKQLAEQANLTSEQVRNEMNNIIREQTSGGDVVPEVVSARGENATLGERLNSTDQQLAQTSSDVDNVKTTKADKDYVEDEILTIDGRKADKATTDALSQNKVDKGGAGQVTWAMAAQDFREQITGGNTAVVAVDSVLEPNIVDGAATFSKRSRLGELASVILGGSTPIPNIDIPNKRIVFSGTFYVIIGKKRYTVTNGATIDYTEATQYTPNPVIYFDTATNTFIAKPQNGTDVASVPESCVLFAYLVFYGGTTVLNSVFMNCRHTINGIESNVYFLDDANKNRINTPIGELPLITVSSSGDFPNLNTTDKTVVFPSTFFIFHRNNRYTVTGGATLNFGVEYPSQSGITIWFDTATQSIYLSNQSASTGKTYTSILLGIIFLVGSEWRLNINTEYKINGNPLYMRYGEIPSTDNQNYRFSLDKVSGSVSDSDVPGIGDLDSPFDYTNDDHNLVYSLFDDLAQSNSNYITKTELGLAYNGLPVNEYNFSPVRVSHSTVKPYPKILLGASVHGGEGLAVTALYYAMKRVTEDWQTDEKLEYLRHNVNFSVIPLRNPGAYNEKLYVYPNGVNINRNFSYGWDSSSDTTKGTAPFSELETQIQRDWMMENQDALFQIDCHVRGGRQIVDDDKLMWLSCSDENQAIIAGNTIETLNKRWHQKYPQLNNTPMLGYLTTGEANGTLRSYAFRELGIPTITWEGFSRSTTMSNMEDKDIVQMNVDYLIQLMLDIVKRYQ